MGRAPAAVVLLSGGLDSATTLAIARREGFEAYALTVRYGQRHRLEVQRAGELAHQLGVAAHQVVDVDLRFIVGSALTDASVPVPKLRTDTEIAEGIPATYVPARNTLFLTLALGWAEALDARDLFIGVNVLDYSGYPDCRPEYLEAFERMANLGTKAGSEGRPFRIRAPLLRSTKAEIIRRAVELGVDLARTLSCYDPGETGEPCTTCDACRLRARGFRDAGVEDPAGKA